MFNFDKDISDISNGFNEKTGNSYLVYEDIVTNLDMDMFVKGTPIKPCTNTKPKSPVFVKKNYNDKINQDLNLKNNFSNVELKNPKPKLKLDDKTISTI